MQISGNYIYVCRFVNERHEVENDIKGHAAAGFRWLPLPDDALDIIRQLKTINPDNDYMFATDDGKFITTVTFNRRLRKCCSDLGIQYRSSHKLRFSTASILYANGVSTPELQKMPGHTSLNMTTHYLRNMAIDTQTFDKVNRIFDTKKRPKN